MDLKQHIHPPFHGTVFQLGGLCIGDRGENDQDAIGAQGAGLGNLIGIIHKIFAQGGQGTGRARLNQEGFGALKAWRIRQDRQAGSAALFIGLG